MTKVNTTYVKMEWAVVSCNKANALQLGQFKLESGLSRLEGGTYPDLEHVTLYTCSNAITTSNITSASSQDQVRLPLPHCSILLH